MSDFSKEGYESKSPDVGESKSEDTTGGNAREEFSSDALAESRYHHLWKHLKVGLVILIVFTAIKVPFETSPFGRWLSIQYYDWCQGFLAKDREDLSVVVVDIAGSGGRASLPDTGLEFTSREFIQDLISKLAPVEKDERAWPAAIGVDIDLSPEENGMVLPGTFQLLEYCHTNNVPVRFGVRRAEFLQPQSWLGAEKYTNLAASISRPIGRVSKMTYSSYHRRGSDTYELPSMGWALAELYGLHNEKETGAKHQHGAAHSWWRHYIDDEPAFEGKANRESITNRYYYMNFSKLPLFQQKVRSAGEILSMNPENLTELIKGKIVILGDVKSHSHNDAASVPNSVEPVPGVFVHACAVDTLTRSGIYTLSHAVGLISSFALSLVVMLTIHFTLLRYAANSDVSANALNIVLTLIAIVLMWFTSLALARWFNLLWLDVAAVCVVLVTHLVFELFIGNVNSSQLRHGKDGLIKALVISSGKDSH